MIQDSLEHLNTNYVVINFVMTLDILIILNRCELLEHAQSTEWLEIVVGTNIDKIFFYDNISF